MTPPPFAHLIRCFGKIGVLSFGGPAAQISLMHNELVDRRRWLGERDFLSALSLCMLLPGPEAMQLATYAGWRLRGVVGGIIAGGLFVLPGAFFVGLIALCYAQFGTVPWVQAAFLGIKATVVVIVFQALFRLSKKTLTNYASWRIGLASFTALFVFNIAFPVIIFAAGAIGFWRGSEPIDPVTAPLEIKPRTFKTALIWGALWGVPALFIWLFADDFYFQIAFFFSKLAVVSFGGAYAALSYMTQTVVTDFGWLSAPQMIDALGLAETTPGPLILVTQFVAMIAGFETGGVMRALFAGLIALWMTFVPCFLWIFVAAPYLERITHYPRLTGALQGVMAAIVGVILNLAVWFTLHVGFERLATAGAFKMPVPVLETIDFRAVLLTGIAALLMLGLRRTFGQTLVIMALAGITLGLGPLA